MAANDEPPEREMKEFYFRALKKIRVQASASPTAPTSSPSTLLTTSNKYGLVFIGTDKGVLVIRSQDITQSGDDDAVTVQPPIWGSITTDASPSHVALSADNITLSVCVQKHAFPFALMYDVRSFAKKNSSPSPFVEVKLSSEPNSHLTDLAWNPGQEFGSMFASVISDGGVGLWQIGNELNIIAKLPAATCATCLCWSPRGKQLVIGKQDASMQQYDQQLKVKKNIPAPDIFSGNRVTAINVLWESTFTFVVAYLPICDDNSEQPIVVVVNSPKTGSLSYVRYEDICFGGSDERRHQYLMKILPDWDIILTCSANAQESGVLGRSKDNKMLWERWDLDDTGRAEIPLTDDYKNAYPTGMAVDLTSTTEVSLGDNMKIPAAPVYMILTSDGLLVLYHMVYLAPGIKQITKAVEALSPEGVREAQGVKNTTLETEASTVVPSTTSVAKSLFQSPPVSNSPAANLPSTAAPADPPAGMFSGFGLNATKSEVVASAAPTSFNFTLPSSPSMSFSKPLGQSTPAFPASSLAQVMKPPAQSDASPPLQAVTLPSDVGANSGKVAEPVNPAPAFNFANMAASSTPPQKSMTPTFNFRNTAGTPQQQVTQVATGGIFTKPAPAKSEPAQSDVTLPAAKSSAFSVVSSSAIGQAGATATSLGSKLASADAVRSRLGSGLSGSPLPGSGGLSGMPGLSMSAASPLPSASRGLVTEVAPAVREPAVHRIERQPELPTAITNAPINRATTTTTPQATLKRPGAFQEQQTSTATTIGPPRSNTTPNNASAVNPFWKSVQDEMSEFEKELRELRQKSSSMKVDIGPQAHLEALKRESDQMVRFCKDICDTTKTIHCEIQDLKAQCLEAFATLEECRLRHERNKDPFYRDLLTSRCLDPMSERKMNEIRTHYHHVDGAIRNADMKLDNEWEAYQKEKNKSRALRTPTTDIVYRTLKANQKIMGGQQRVIEQLVSEMKQMRIYSNPSPQWTPSLSTPSRYSDQNRMSSTPLKDGRSCYQQHHNLSPSPKKNARSPISPDKRAKLKEALSNRRIAPVKSTVPANLSMSRLVSADSLRKMLAEESSPTKPVSATPPRATPPSSSYLDQKSYTSSPVKFIEKAPLSGRSPHEPRSAMSGPGALTVSREQPVRVSPSRPIPVKPDIHFQNAASPHSAGLPANKFPGEGIFSGSATKTDKPSFFAEVNKGKETAATNAFPSANNFSFQKKKGALGEMTALTAGTTTTPSTGFKFSANTMSQFARESSGDNGDGSLPDSQESTDSEEPFASDVQAGLNTSRLTTGLPTNAGFNFSAFQDRGPPQKPGTPQTSILQGKQTVPTNFTGMNLSTPVNTSSPETMQKAFKLAAMASNSSSPAFSFNSKDTSSNTGFMFGGSDHGTLPVSSPSLGFSMTLPSALMSRRSTDSPIPQAGLTSAVPASKSSAESPAIQKSDIPFSGSVTAEASKSIFAGRGASTGFMFGGSQTTGSPSSTSDNTNTAPQNTKSAFFPGISSSLSDYPGDNVKAKKFSLEPTTMVSSIKESQHETIRAIGRITPEASSPAVSSPALNLQIQTNSAASPVPQSLTQASSTGAIGIQDTKDGKGTPVVQDVTGRAPDPSTVTDAKTVTDPRILTDPRTVTKTVDQAINKEFIPSTSTAAAPADTSTMLPSATATDQDVSTSEAVCKAQTASSTTAKSLFGSAAELSAAQNGLFGAAVTTSTTTPTTAKSFLGSAADLNAAQNGLFGATLTTSTSMPASSTTTSDKSLPSSTVVNSSTQPSSAFASLAQTTTPTSSIFGSTVTPSTTQAGSVFGSASGTAPAGSVFGTAASANGTTQAGSIFGSGATPSTTQASSVFGSSANTSTTQASSVFGSASTPSTTQASSVFGSSANTSTTQASSVFGSTTTAITTQASSVFGSASTPSTTQASSVFGSSANTSTTQASSVFGSTTTAITTQAGSVFGSTTPSTTQAASVFGSVTTPGTTQTSSVFGSAAAATTTQAGSVFGSAPNASNTAQPGSVFGAKAPGQSSTLFGSAAPSTLASTTSASSTGSSVFGEGNSSTSAFGGFSKPTFGGQTAPTNSVFGNTGQQTQASGFDQSSVFGRPAASGSVFGGQAASTTEGGGGLFFGGLGGKPSEENAGKNVFGGTQFGGGQNTQASSIFGAQNASSAFNTIKTSVGFSGSFSGGGSVSVAGFGSVQPANTANKSGFGGNAAFGASPSFASSPPTASTGTFGNTASFSSPFGGIGAASPPKVFGGQSTEATPAFSGFANATSPTFGSLSQNNNAPTFGALAQPSNGVFGGDAAAGAAGSAGFGGFNSSGSVFSGNNNSGFGATSPQSPSFTSYRG